MAGLANYPSTHGGEPLRTAIAGWLERRYAVPALDANTMVLPVNGSREALFAIAQCVIDPRAGAKNSAATSNGGPLVMCPNPFYQIYEGAAYLAGAEPYFVNSQPARNFGCDYGSVPAEVWARVQLLYV
jgi:N-succinyldiaminopimelate aminotransferase